MKITIGQRGETIVEVLIAIAVIGSVLGTSYAIVSRNNSSYQQVSERTQALKFAEQQLEFIRGLAPASRTAIPSSDTFCITGTTIEYDENNCKYDNDRYLVTSTKSGTSNFAVKVAWDGINGDAEEVELGYRIP